MYEREHGTEVPRYAVVWEAGRTHGAIDADDHAAQYAAALAHALTTAGYPPQRLEIEVAEPSPDRLEIDVLGVVPELDETSFFSIARIAVSGCRAWQALPPGSDIQLRAVLGPPSTFPPEVVESSVPLIPASVQMAAEQMPISAEHAGGHGMIIAMVALIAAAALIYFLTHLPFEGPAAVPTPVPVRPLPTPTAVPPTPAAPLTPVPTAGGLRTVLDERFTSPSDFWPDDPSGPAWFGIGGYHLATREPGLFVAVAAPLPGPLDEVVATATFVKNSGPEGGGYGVILRDQGTSPLDGLTQDGRFLLFEVGDRGEVSIWQRDRVRWTAVMPWRHSDAVRPGQAENELKVIGHEDQVSFVVNAQQVAGLVYAGLPTRGGVGVFLGGDLNEVTVTRLTIQVP
jgi:hypothetical protein